MPIIPIKIIFLLNNSDSFLSIRKKYNGIINMDTKIILIKIIDMHNIVKTYTLSLLNSFLFIKKFLT